jgi:hypothetical protein
VAEVPGQRTEERGVDAVELLVFELFDEEEGPRSRLRQSLGDLVLDDWRGGSRDA